MFGKVPGFKPGTLPSIMGKGATPDLNGGQNWHDPFVIHVGQFLQVC
jgi:hypothetical protein